MQPYLVLARVRLHGVELVRIARRHADVADLARLDNVVQRDHELLHARVGRVAVDLEDVDVVEAKALEALVDRVEDVLAREAVAVDIAGRDRVLDLGRVRVRVVGDDHGELGENDEVLARDRVLLDCLADETLAVAVRVDVGRVPGVDAELVGRLEVLKSLVTLKNPVGPACAAAASASISWRRRQKRAHPCCRTTCCRQEPRHQLCRKIATGMCAYQPRMTFT